MKYIHKVWKRYKVACERCIAISLSGKPQQWRPTWRHQDRSAFVNQEKQLVWPAYKYTHWMNEPLKPSNEYNKRQPCCYDPEFFNAKRKQNVGKSTCNNKGIQLSIDIAWNLISLSRRLQAKSFHLVGHRFDEHGIFHILLDNRIILNHKFENQIIRWGLRALGTAGTLGMA